MAAATGSGACFENVVIFAVMKSRERVKGRNSVVPHTNDGERKEQDRE